MIAGIAVAMVAITVITYAIWSERALLALARRLERFAPAAARHTAHARMIDCVESIETRFAALEQRLDQRHLVSGLPTREPLLAQIAGDGAGLIGLIAFTDLDRLSAFDPALGERALLVLVDRLTRMLNGRRPVAHVDRAHLAIWFGPAIDRDVARAELDAIGYALSDVIDDGADSLLPGLRTGTARFPEDGATPQILLTRAIGALASGPATAQAVIADPAAAARDRYAIEQDLRQAIARKQFEMHYQPLIDTDAGRVCGAEALLRWHHPTRGQVPPSRFVPVVEAAGLADEVGLWALNAACRAAHGWQRQQLGPLRVAVNVSGHQLDRDDMCTLVERTLARHSLAPGCLEIELTESVAAGDTGRTARLFDSLRALGVRIAIDDFGTGYSSFSALRTLSFDKIKIDREFVTAVDTRRDSQAICQSIVALGRGLGIRVLAEGVERRAEYEWLRRHGCRHFQGYYFSQPLPGPSFTAFVRDQAGLAALLAVDPDAAQAHINERLTG